MTKTHEVAPAGVARTGCLRQGGPASFGDVNHVGEGHTAEGQEKWPSLNVELDRFTFHPTGNRPFNFPMRTSRSEYFRLARNPPEASGDLSGRLVLRLKGLQGIGDRGEPVNSPEPRIYSFVTQPLADR